ncbi:hypothetical protein [Martelella sp. AD-3]|uniref:hypothetical protein n=1 Tax=Martelella sp. AD-3 TaxID=686597 RepID=UPI0004641C5C|nr:hypothetical protein [Martelella sp. AD-3]AMM84347.1 hypothetical protein AZF01_08225 [Martelella sp. AD-3]
MNWKASTLIGLVAIVSAGCVSESSPFSRANPAFEKYYNGPTAKSKALEKSFSGHTRMTYEPVHGTQVEYFSPDGRTYLWYPGNTVVLPGLWEVRSYTMPNLDLTNINRPVVRVEEVIPLCFQYGKKTYNPATRKHGDYWSCSIASPRPITRGELRQGDIFRLSERVKPPFILPKDKTTFTALLKQCGDC